MNQTLLWSHRATIANKSANVLIEEGRQWIKKNKTENIVCQMAQRRTLQDRKREWKGAKIVTGTAKGSIWMVL